MSLEEFLTWEAEQGERYEFDGIQPIAMTGASPQHMLIVTWLILNLAPRLRRGCVPLANALKVVSDRKVRYPDLTIVCGPVAAQADRVEPVIVFEVLSPFTALTDERVKPLDYAAVPSVQAYVTVAQAGHRMMVRRRMTGWVPETIAGAGAILALLEVGVELPLADIYEGVDFSGMELP